MKKLNLGFIYNVRHTAPDLNNPQYLLEAEFDTPETIAGITGALESLGHTVYPVEADEDAYPKLKELKGKVDLVFNVAEGIRGADREAQLPAMMEMLGLPYTGPPPIGYALGLNKAVAKEILAYYHILTPRWRTVSRLEELEQKQFDFMPVIAKPLSEGSSKGIQAKNLVHNLADLKTITAELLAAYHQPVLLEEYLPGREFTVGVIGTPPEVLPIIEVSFDALPPEMPKFDHFEAKWVYDNPATEADPLVCPAVLSPELEGQIKNLCLQAFDVLEMADWARFDVRLDKNNLPHILEVNCPPGIIPDPKENSRFPRAARTAGYSFPQMLEKILLSACHKTLAPP
ncbi:MAG: D-alanine--D-alanine ligase [Patescibacteria group bacterium]|jgi:D-alanine-D-alanine ligase